jgi:hypothetical protein
VSFVVKLASETNGLAARGETVAAFDGRCIPPGGVAPPSNIPDILGRRALPGGRIARLGATRQFHHGLLALSDTAWPTWTSRRVTDGDFSP